jgi:hypothetical protein
MRIGLLLIVLVLVGVPLAINRGWLDVPPRWDPWAPLDVHAPRNLLTSFKLWRVQNEPPLCEAALQTSSLRYTHQPDSSPAAQCPLENVLRITESELGFNQSFLATCKLAVAFALFERHGLQPAAQAVFGQSVVRIEHYGSFACRNIGGSQRRSQHASANALDIAAFRLQDGRRISVVNDWQGATEEALFLRRVHQAACEHFKVTLGPEYNAAHRDHFHVDMGGFRMCR